MRERDIAVHINKVKIGPKINPSDAELQFLVERFLREFTESEFNTILCTHCVLCIELSPGNNDDPNILVINYRDQEFMTVPNTVGAMPCIYFTIENIMISRGPLHYDATHYLISVNIDIAE